MPYKAKKIQNLMFFLKEKGQKEEVIFLKKQKKKWLKNQYRENLNLPLLNFLNIP